MEIKTIPTVGAVCDRALFLSCCESRAVTDRAYSWAHPDFLKSTESLAEVRGSELARHVNETMVTLGKVRYLDTSGPSMARASIYLAHQPPQHKQSAIADH